MWICTRYGFFSAVAAWVSQDNPTPNPEVLMVRARKREHLVNLKARFKELEHKAIVNDFGTDYPFRIFLPRVIWAVIMDKLTREIDYTNFKNEVHRISGDKQYEDFLANTWAEGVAMEGDLPNESLHLFQRRMRKV